MSNLYHALTVLLKDIKFIFNLNKKSFFYYIKEVLDYSCFLHLALSHMLSKTGLTSLHVPGEGFPRENCLFHFLSDRVTFYNESPSINLERLNTFNMYRRSNTVYTNELKKYFIQNFFTYNKNTIKLSCFINSLSENKSLVIIEGFSNKSRIYCETLYKNLLLNSHIQELKVNLYYKPHPRRTNSVTIDIKSDFIVLACTSTQFAITRHFKSPITQNYHITNSNGNVFDPCPYSTIPLIIHE
jgi:hypothetical protein